MASGSHPPAVEHRLALPPAYDFDETVRFVPLGAYDPTCRREPGAFVKAGRTPTGPATLEIRRQNASALLRGFGSGAAWVLERAGRMLGLHDDPAAFQPKAGGRLAILARRGRGLHLGRTPFVFDNVCGVILQQRVAWRDATRAWRRLVSAHAEEAPGPHGLRLPLSPRQWLSLTSHDLQAAGVDGQRARALRAAARNAAALDATFAEPRDEARRVLASVPGCGPWTVEMTMGHGLGDPDAVITGDLHLPALVAYALEGESLGPVDDARMIRLLEPHRGHRFRLVRLLYAAGLGTSLTTRSRAARSWP
jgi:3-methyladenine DNA glycosylase/8-oxoguanine DNA glycosylase